MTSAQDNTLFQSEHHPLVDVAPAVLEEHCLSLIHRKAYETAAGHALGKEVLDLGCNDGYGTAIVGAEARRAIGVDLSLKAVQTARQTHPDFEFVHLTEPTLPFSDASFDVVTAFQVIEHVTEVPPFLQEIRRVLRPGGAALFTTPNRALRLEDGMRAWNPFHVREYVASELRAVLAEHFDEVEVLGLAGSQRFERVERARLARHVRLQRRSEAGLPWRAAATLEFRFHRVLRQAAKAARQVPFLSDFSTRRMSTYGTADLRYSADALETALDLFARAVVR